MDSNGQAQKGRHLSKFFKALSDETRRGILNLLEDGDRTVGEIVGEFHLSQPTISRHLSVLKEAELVADRRQGQRVVYSLRDGAMARSVEAFFGGFRQCQTHPSTFGTSPGSPLAETAAPIS
jgi:DNA-binding transcriptional ArsR family regulator